MTWLKNIFPVLIRQWLPLAFVMTITAGLVYGTVQQSYRQGANDPQIQLAEDIADAINGGVDPTTLVGSGKLDMAKSLSTFLIVVDKDNKVVADNVQLGGKSVNVPIGPIDQARQHGQNRITWQPQANVRNAIVLQPVLSQKGEVVIVGRSLREVEIREGQLTSMVFLAWAVGLAGSLILVWLGQMVPKPKTA